MSLSEVYSSNSVELTDAERREWRRVLGALRPSGTEVVFQLPDETDMPLAKLTATPEPSSDPEATFSLVA